MTIFSVLLAFGSILGLAWTVLETPKANQEISLEAGILALCSALIGGRGAYVAVHWAYFQHHLIEIPQFWLGGFSWPGALIGGILGTLLASLVFGIRLGILTDRLLPLLTSLAVAIWLGCWLTGCAYGPEVIWGLPTKDEWGTWNQRLPVQLIGAILTVAVFWGIEQFRDRTSSMIPGLAASLGLAGLSLILFVTSLLRVDPYPLYKGFRLETWSAMFLLGLSIISSIGLFLIYRRQT